jgi:alkaline phosphatase D
MITTNSPKRKPHFIHTLMCAFVFLLLSNTALAQLRLDPKTTLTHIALGSCARQNQPQPIWSTIVKSKPQLFLFIGDNIYGDTENMNTLRSKYAQLGNIEGYKKLLNTCPLLATWDDHDYGRNDAGIEYAKKVESQKIFLEFYKEPKNSPRWNRPGVYNSYIFGPANKRVQIILLDTRYFRSPLKKWPRGARKTPGPYMADPDPIKTMLGDAQWTWLKDELKNPAQLRIIASSIQVVPDQHGWEYWQTLPLQRSKLFKLIGETNANGVIFISGDRHLAEISKLAATDKQNGAGYPIYDLTSSSLNVPSGGNANEINRHRIGGNYRKINFGSIKINWNKDTTPNAIATVQLSIHDITGATVRTVTIDAATLEKSSSKK